MRRMGRLFLLSLVGAAACATPRESTPVDDPTGSPVAAERGPTRADREASHVTVADHEPAREAPPSTVVHLVVAPIESPDGEDGLGAVVRATRAVTLDLHRDGGWPGRALDPRLHIGALEFRRYRHVGAEVLRFIAADGDAIDGGADAWVQWGDDESSRLDVVPAALEGGAGSVDL